MDQFDQLLEIRLEDGRAIVAQPRPEDQDYLRQAGGSVTIELGGPDLDTAAHGLTSDLTLDVEGHAMTLRLPTPADAEALRRMLMVGAITATVVAAGAIASLQDVGRTTAGESIVAPPRPAAAARQDFAQRREQAIDQLLEAPAIVGEPSDIQFERFDRISAPSPAQPRPDFKTRREQAADRLLEAPGAGAPAAPADPDAGHRVGGPQD